MLRLLHTGDWHLGHTLHGRDRQVEHRAFLAWLLDTLDQTKADALLIAGDVFETANPPASAIHDLNTFLSDARRRLPALDIVIIAGNHDSALRLDAMAPLMAFAQVRVVGGLPRSADGELDAARLIVPLSDASGEVAGQLAAVPFLRVADLPSPEPRVKAEVGDAEVGDAEVGDTPADPVVDPLIDGVARLYEAALEAAQTQAEPGHALIATGHLYMRGTALSELSERKILGGNQHAIPRAIFADAWAYVGLGHLHLAQAVEQSEQVRYSGSPIPLSLTEADYEHQVLLLSFDGPELALCQSIVVPRAVEVLRIPEAGPAPLDQVLFELQGLSLDKSLDRAHWPWLEVRVRLDQPQPDLRQSIDVALRDRPVRLLKISVEQAGEGGSFADFPVRRDLDRIDPQQVFVDCYARAYGEDPGPVLIGAFHELREAIAQGDPALAQLPPLAVGEGDPGSPEPETRAGGDRP